MPNWAEGSLKLRGKSENIASALKEMLLNDTLTLKEAWDGTLLRFDSTAPYFYINKTRRAFIDQKQIEVWLEEKFVSLNWIISSKRGVLFQKIIKKFQVSLMLILKFLRLSVAWNSRRKLKFPKVKSSKTFALNMMIISGKSHLVIWEVE